MMNQCLFDHELKLYLQVRNCILFLQEIFRETFENSLKNFACMNEEIEVHRDP